MEPGDLATWAGSSFAAIAAGATLWTLKSQRDQIGEQRRFIGEQSANLELERAELRAAAEDRKWAQARQVRVQHRKAGATTDAGGAHVEATHWVVTVHNDTDAPVRQVQVHFGESSIAAEVYQVVPDRPGASRNEPGDRLVAPVDLIGAGRRVRFLSQEWPPAPLHNNKPSVRFTDDNGVRWRLDYWGKLEEVPPDPWA